MKFRQSTSVALTPFNSICTTTITSSILIRRSNAIRRRWPSARYRERGRDEDRGGGHPGESDSCHKRSAELAGLLQEELERVPGRRRSSSRAKRGRVGGLHAVCRRSVHLWATQRTNVRRRMNEVDGSRLRSRVESTDAATPDGDAGLLDFAPKCRGESFRRERDRREWPGGDAFSLDTPAIA